MKKNLLSAAVKGALGLTAAAIMVPAMPAFAQDDATLVEEVVVTGSRIKRTNFDEAAQVVSMDRADIDAGGSLMIADTLRNTPLNSLGSFNERSGSSAQSNATVDLRGLGDQRSLVMINGRRLPGSPNLGAATVNLNMIPMAAVERIDILADGASAVYGSDAVAGVVNMIMREDFNGLEFSARHGDRSEDDGIEESFSFITGVSGDRGNITFAAEFDRRDAIFDADRDYTAAYVQDDGDGRLDAYLDTDGYSYYGKTIEIYDPTTEYYDIQAATSCADDSIFVETGALAFGEADGTLCTYPYGNISANKAELKRINTYMTANYEISDKVEFFSNVLFSKVDSFGRYAPPAATWYDMPADYSDVPFDVDSLLADGSITDDYEINGYYRWTNIGNRDNVVSDTQYDVTLGLRGDLSDNVSYETYIQKGRYESKEFGTYYLSYTGLDYVLAEDIDPFSEEGAAAMKATVSQDNFTAMSKAYGHVQFGIGDFFGAGDTLVLAGAEAYNMEYGNQYDAASEAGLVGGSSGNSSSGDRDVIALFAEAIVPVTDAIEVSTALRYDDYSDFGSNVAPTLSANYRVTDTLSLRARVGKGFRAPALDELYGPSSFSAEDATDPETGLSRQWDTYYSTNEDLEAETSTSMSIGGNWEFIDDWTLDIGFWNVEVDDVIIRPSAQSVFYAAAAGVDLPESGGIYTTGSGAQTTVYSQTTNAGVLDVTGVDIAVDGSFELPYGMLAVNSLITHQLSYETDAYYGGPVQDVSGFNLYPDLRAQFGLNWSMDRHSVDLTIDYITSHDEFTDVTDSGELVKSGEDLDSWTTMNLSYSIDTDSYGLIKVGARNLTNEDPVLDKDGKFSRDHYSLYDNTGRVLYAEYTMSF
ncbi:TonB-dependent receptor [Microbulbifer sp. VAAF005]|uniref:TonB-dependent receptor plug domain-containing protein n=1 Tax=Microbulbifer sp. VAAF005 TaxID=3034230 RepID=UPI0024AD9CA5|nr:TonB-dependent receptor [Microbulbifer sp. VAAF005]WHI48611.1 TonB-dependent receptor [Microbulbifer sp. VAAF005]